jgi:hypothetical protein
MTNIEIKQFCKEMKVSFTSLIDDVLTTRHKQPIIGAREDFKFKTVGKHIIYLHWKIEPNEAPYLIGRTKVIDNPQD